MIGTEGGLADGDGAVVAIAGLGVIEARFVSAADVPLDQRDVRVPGPEELLVDSERAAIVGQRIIDGSELDGGGTERGERACDLEAVASVQLLAPRQRLLP